MTQPNDAPSDGNKKPSSETVDHEDVARLVDEAILGDEVPQGDQPKAEATSPLLQLGVNDEANACAVTLLYPDEFAFTESHGWLHYTDGHWATENAEAAVERAVVETLKTRVRDGLDEDAQAYEKVIRFCTPNSSRVKGTVHLLRSKVAVSQSLFDVEPDLLNCPNGVVDLRTGKLLPHASEYRFMHMAGVAYDPQASSAVWEDWLTETVGDPQVAHYLQMAAGYTLTGRTSEEVVFYICGPPRSGKGIFIETLRLTLGEQLARVIPFSVLTAKADVDSQNFALAPLKPTRLVLASESNQYERFNEAKLKSITGGDAISCSFKHRDAFTYRPQFKVWITSNQPIRADPDDDAV
jgi:putative DNA primase/helicase